MRPNRGLSKLRLALQVPFRDMPTSESVEAEIRRRAERLDEYCDRVMSCRVTAPRSARRGRSGGADRDPVRPGRCALAKRFCRSTSRYRARGRCQRASQRASGRARRYAARRAPSRSRSSSRRGLHQAARGVRRRRNRCSKRGENRWRMARCGRDPTWRPSAASPWRSESAPRPRRREHRGRQKRSRLNVLVGREGLEPSTNGLKVRCSTD